LLSAVWHGIYLTYYIGFLEWAFVANISKFFFKASWKFGRWEGTTSLKILTWIISNLFLNYIGTFILMLNFSLGVAYYNSLFWFGTIVMVAVHVFFSVTNWGQRPSKPKTSVPLESESKVN